MGQARAQKAAEAARGRQLGKAQREALKRAQAAAKKRAAAKKGLVEKAAARKTPARKAVPLSRESSRAAYPGTCQTCFKDYGEGEVITEVTDGWGHLGCAPRQMYAAEREFARNKAGIESGEAFRGHKLADWRRGASPSNTRPAR
ncbi:hypothetical protein [Streptomyces sp. NPDC046759]|uniref:hypothetical protein n=1 Tax=Streptomyces sp. NPDC046759 TaxID=3155019 RepID=UPI003411D413